MRCRLAQFDSTNSLVGLATVDEESAFNLGPQTSPDEPGEFEITISQNESSPPESSSESDTAESRHEIDSLDRDALVADLATLYSDAEALLSMFQDPGEQLQNLVKELTLSQSKASTRLQNRSNTLKDSREAYGQSSLIRTDFVTRKLLYLELDDPIPMGPWRPDGILYLANMATCLSIMLRHNRQYNQVLSLLMLFHNTFPTPFASGVALTEDTLIPFATNLVNETVELALDLRTQLTIAMLSAHSKEPNFDPDVVLEKIWYEEDRKTIRLINHLDHATAPSSVLRGCKARMKDIRKYFSKSTEHPVDFKNLDVAYPWEDFLVNMLLWIQARRSEIEAQVTRQGGVQIIQKLLKEEDPTQLLAHTDRYATNPLGTRSPLQQIDRTRKAVGSFAKLSRKPALQPPPTERLRSADVRKRLLEAKNRRLHLNPVPSSAQQNNATPPSAQPPADISDSPRVPADNDDTEESLKPTRSTQETITLSQKGAEVMKVVHHHEAERNKENIDASRPRQKHFTDRQAGATRIEFDSQHDNKPARKARKRQYDDTDDEDEAFETDTRPVKTPDRAKRAKNVTPRREASDSESSLSPSQTQRDLQLPSSAPEQAPMNSSRSPPQHRTNPQLPTSSAPTTTGRPRGRPSGSKKKSTATPTEYEASRGGPRQTRPVVEEDSEWDEEQEQERPALPRYAEINARAKAQAAFLRAHKSQLGVKPPQRRVPWSAEEVERLIELVETCGTSWSGIMLADARHENGPLLQERGQVGLKDKARNMKIDWMK